MGNRSRRRLNRKEKEKEMGRREGKRSPSPSLRPSIVSEIGVGKDEVKKSNLGFVFCCGTGVWNHEGEISWYTVDSVLKDGPATQLTSPAVWRFGGFSCVCMGSKLIVLGGCIDLEASRHVYCLDKDDGMRWTRLPDMIRRREKPAVVSCQNKVYVFGCLYSYDGHLSESDFGEYLDMSLPRDQWEWMPVRVAPPSKYPMFWPVVAAFVINIDGQEEIAMGLRLPNLTYSFNPETHEWTDRTASYPGLDWCFAGDVDAVIVDDILLWTRGGIYVYAYDLKNCSPIRHPVTGLEAYSKPGHFLFSRKRDLYLFYVDEVPPFTARCITFQIETAVDSQGMPTTVSAIVKAETGPFGLVSDPFLLFLLKQNKL